MGGFYGSVQIRSEDRDSVRAAVERIATGRRRFLIGPPLGGWIGVYPSGSGQDFGVAKDLAARLPGELIAMLVHDNDIFAYEYYRDGDRIDQYDSIPDYFHEVSDEERRSLRGRPEAIEHLARDPVAFAAVRQRLAAQAVKREVFASDLLLAFAEALGIRNALTSYEYLQENEETDHVERWDLFIHVPDLTAEKAREREVEAAVEAKKRRLIAERRLLAERGGALRWPGPHPWVAPSPDGRGFLAVWSGVPRQAEGPRPLLHEGPPWPDEPEATPWTLGPEDHGPQLSPSGRYLAATRRADGWKVAVWDLPDNRLAATVPLGDRAYCVGFLPDESAVLSVGVAKEGCVAITPIDGGEARVIPLPNVKLVEAHPSGSSLVIVDQSNRLHIVDVASGRVKRTHHVGAVPAPAALTRLMPDPDALEQRLRQQHAGLLEALEKSGLPPGFDSVEAFRAHIDRTLDEQIHRMREVFAQGGPLAIRMPVLRASEIVFRVRFDPSGNRMALGTRAGIRVFAWPEIVDADGAFPRPEFALDVVGTAADAGRGAESPSHGHAHDIEYDPARDRFLFASLDGRIRFLDPAPGRSGILLDPPGRPPIQRVVLSRDRSALALIAMPGQFSRSLKRRRAPILQFWDYQKISRETPL
jgi:hypothetical protein